MDETVSGWHIRYGLSCVAALKMSPANAPAVHNLSIERLGAAWYGKKCRGPSTPPLPFGRSDSLRMTEFEGFKSPYAETDRIHPLSSICEGRRTSSQVLAVNDFGNPLEQRSSSLAARQRYRMQRAVLFVAARDGRSSGTDSLVRLDSCHCSRVPKPETKSVL